MKQVTKAQFMSAMEEGALEWPPFAYDGRVYGFIAAAHAVAGESRVVYFEETP